MIGSLYLTTGDPGHIGMTIIDGDSSGTVVTFENEENENAQLIGISIRNGYTDGMGGGINCVNASPTISDCFIMSNFARTRGGGIACEPHASPLIDNCEIILNSSGSGGGGIWCGDLSHPTIRNCIISENAAGWNGAGINMYISCHPTVENCIIRNNHAEHNGGGIIVSQDCHPEITNCYIEYNRSIDTGGGITIERGATPTLRRCLIHRNYTDGKGGSFAAIQNSFPRFINCVMSWNTANVDGGSIYCADSHPVLVNSVHYIQNFPVSIIFDPDSAASSITIAYSDIEDSLESIVTNDNGEVNWLEYNRDDDPMFVNADDGVFNLRAGSPCVDVGTSLFVWEDDTLVNYGEDEYNGNAPDIGAIESEYTGINPHYCNHPGGFHIISTYPNPFNSTVRITFNLPCRRIIYGAVINLCGRKVYDWTTGNLNAGKHDLIWNATDVPNGIYIVTLSDGRETRHIKLLNVK